MSNLADHARRELELINEEPEVVNAHMEIIEIFGKMGHSGASAHFFIGQLERLLRFGNLSPLTSAPDEWMLVSVDLWQNRRNSEAFSKDGGHSYYLLSEVRGSRWRWMPPNYPMHLSDSPRKEG